MEYNKKYNSICFDIGEFTELFKGGGLKKMEAAMQKFGFSLDDLKNDRQKMQKIAGYVAGEIMKKKESIEYFAAMNFCAIYFGANSKIVFEMISSFDSNKMIVNDIDDLKKYAKENTLNDFGIFHNNELRMFQLKQYRGVLDTDSFYNFLEKKIIEYGNLGDTNLLFVLQGVNGGKIISDDECVASRADIDFKDISKRIKKLELKCRGEILIKYNDMNRNNVLVKIYPEFVVGFSKINDKYLAGEILYS